MNAQLKERLGLLEAFVFGFGLNEIMSEISFCHTNNKQCSITSL
jgi:hypothetical protein